MSPSLAPAVLQLDASEQPQERSIAVVSDQPASSTSPATTTPISKLIVTSHVMDSKCRTEPLFNRMVSATEWRANTSRGDVGPKTGNSAVDECDPHVESRSRARSAVSRFRPHHPPLQAKQDRPNLWEPAACRTPLKWSGLVSTGPRRATSSSADDRACDQ